MRVFVCVISWVALHSTASKLCCAVVPQFLRAAYFSKTVTISYLSKFHQPQQTQSPPSPWEVNKDPNPIYHTLRAAVPSSSDQVGLAALLRNGKSDKLHLDKNLGVSHPSMKNTYHRVSKGFFVDMEKCDGNAPGTTKTEPSQLSQLSWLLTTGKPSRLWWGGSHHVKQNIHQNYTGWYHMYMETSKKIIIQIEQ